MERKYNSNIFTKEMKKTHTILAPAMLPIHFEIIGSALREEGYKIEFLEGEKEKIVHLGLKFANNDICYPAMIVIGQFIEALKSGKYDVNKVALLMTQTGGGCRASNYIYLIRKALKSSGYGNIPVIGLSASGIENHPGFKLNPKLIIKLIYGAYYGDLIMNLYNQCKPYEIENCNSEIVVKENIKYVSNNLNKWRFLRLNKISKHIVNEFSKIERNNIEKIKVGIVGEIYMKYSSIGNNKLEEFLINENAEVVMSGVCDFLLYCMYNPIVDNKLYGMKKIISKFSFIGYKYLCYIQSKGIKIVRKISKFRPPTEFEKVCKIVDGYISHGVKMGEGWLLTGEMLELIDSGVNNIVCAQPFGCLANHVVGRGMTRRIINKNPKANIVVIDYDPSETAVNQENRIKLMLANAKLK